MCKKYLRLPVLAVLFAFIGAVAAIAFDSPLSEKDAPFKKPYEIMQMFYQAIENNELIAFKKALKRSDIIPLQVNYTYQLDSPAPVIHIYSELKQPMPLPNNPQCKASAITATLDMEGHIVETIVHVHSCE